MSQDGKRVLTCQKNKDNTYSVKSIDVDTGKKTGLENAPWIVKTATFSSDNNWVAVAYHRQNVIRLWDLRDFDRENNWLIGHQGAVEALAFSADNRWLVSGSWDNTVRVWDLLTRQPVHRFEGHSEHVNAVAISPSGTQLASGASGLTDTSILIWDLRKSLLPPLTQKNSKRYQDFENVWTDLADESHQTSLAATKVLIDDHQRLLKPLQTLISADTTNTTVELVRQAIKKLNHPKFQVRESATQKILSLRAQAESQLREILNGSISPEVRYRITKILSRPVERPKLEDSEIRRWHRTILALEWMEDSSAEEVLSQIADGHPDFVVAQEAAAALKRKTAMSPKAE
jgi:hypothetical protein